MFILLHHGKIYELQFTIYDLFLEVFMAKVFCSAL